jgi:hypothetical protein
MPTTKPKTPDRQELQAMIHIQQDRDAERQAQLAALVRLERGVAEDQVFDAVCRARGRR